MQFFFDFAKLADGDIELVTVITNAACIRYQLLGRPYSQVSCVQALCTETFCRGASKLVSGLYLTPQLLLLHFHPLIMEFISDIPILTAHVAIALPYIRSCCIAHTLLEASSHFTWVMCTLSLACTRCAHRE